MQLLILITITTRESILARKLHNDFCPWGDHRIIYTKTFTVSDTVIHPMSSSHPMGIPGEVICGMNTVTEAPKSSIDCLIS